MRIAPAKTGTLGLMRFSMHVDYATVVELQNTLRGLPARVEKTVMRGAVRKAAVIIRDAVRARVPVGKSKQSVLPHLRDTVDIKKREYKSGKNGKVIYSAIGYRTEVWGGARRVKPNAHLVEYGTAPRFTGHKSDYTQVGTKKIKTRKGWVFKRIRKSIGSEAIAGRRQRYTGIMPAYRPTTSAYSSVANQARQAMIAEVRAGMNKALSRHSKKVSSTFGGIGL